jgi:hypothetical protein
LANCVTDRRIVGSLIVVMTAPARARAEPTPPAEERQTRVCDIEEVTSSLWRRFSETEAQGVGQPMHCASGICVRSPGCTSGALD